MKFKQYPLLISVFLILLSLFVPVSLFGLAISILIVAISMFRPKQGLLFLLIYFPVRPFIMEFNSGLKYLGDLLIISLFIYVFITNFSKCKEIMKHWIFLIGFGTFCIIGTISAFESGTSLTAIIFQYRAFIITLLMFFIIRLIKITKEDVISMLWTTVITATIICIHGIIEKVSLRTLLLPEAWKEMWLPETNRIRIYGLLGNPNVLATYLSFAFFAVLYLKRQIADKYRIILTIISVIIFGVFLLTYSRGTFIAFLTGLIVYFLLNRNWKLLKTIAISIILSIPLVYYPVVTASNFIEHQKNPQAESTGKNQKNGDFSKRLTESVDKNTIQQSMEWGRLYIVVRGFEIFKENPIIGTGFGTYGDSASFVYSSPIADKYNLPKDMYSDNQYIQIIVQTGSLGVISFAVFILGILYYLWKQRKIDDTAIPVIAILIGGSVAGVFYNIWEDKTFTLYFYILLGYTLSLSITNNHKTESL